MSAQNAPLILIIDDFPEGIRSVVERLRAEHLRVSVAQDGQQGLSRAQALVPDLILLDVIMPGMDGFAVCRLLQASPHTRDIPIIFLTSASADDKRLHGLNHGGVDYVVKPCLPAEVLARVRIHLRLALHTGPGGQEPPVEALSPEEITLRAAMRLISANLASLPELDELAHEVGAHDKKLSAIFRRHLGMTVFAWVREERLRCSREWLISTKMSIQDIAAQVGFHSAANFATAFRQRTGVTPSHYRKSAQQASLGDTAGAD